MIYPPAQYVIERPVDNKQFVGVVVSKTSMIWRHQAGDVGVIQEGVNRFKAIDFRVYGSGAFATTLAQAQKIAERWALRRVSVH